MPSFINRENRVAYGVIAVVVLLVLTTVGLNIIQDYMPWNMIVTSLGIVILVALGYYAIFAVWQYFFTEKPDLTSICLRMQFVPSMLSPMTEPRPERKWFAWGHYPSE